MSDVRVYIVECDARQLMSSPEGDAFLADALQRVSPRRRDAAMRLKNKDAQLLSALAELLLRYALRDAYGIEVLPEIEITPLGKPCFVNSDIQFNVSHCRKAVACAVGRCAVGVDVETIGRYKPALAQRVLSEEELATLADAPEPAFTRLWTCKEAYLKYTGEGLRRELTTLLPEAAASGAHFTTWTGAGYCCTVCTPKGIRCCESRKWELAVVSTASGKGAKKCYN